ncbi:FkbM family methyltransferase [Methylococcus sp. Mc7]|uniref:FkbM family methyltransferase n=1 Tax=Methylococcus sp. Mc7 TaxID=2860258 RepID=UPI001C5340DE|nr:FkbM family methyltransferase [Methylococcus sp. Mc7]QXP84025.1 FkbM family methyltransferase [Methylococcus sp. Mc7]
MKSVVAQLQFLRRLCVGYCSYNTLLPSVFARTPVTKLREIFFLPESPHVTQLNQDIFALLVNRFRTGFFVEIGANDGFMLSNTVYLEEQFGWNGLLVEANPQYLESLKNRKSKSVIAAVVEKEGHYEFCSAGLYGGITNLLDKTHEKRTREADSITVWGTTLERILEENGAPGLINFISIDVEGAEVPIVEQMCRLRNYRFVCGCIEYNARQGDYRQIKSLLKDAGYHIVWEGQTQHDLFFVDERGLASSG